MAKLKIEIANSCKPLVEFLIASVKELKAPTKLATIVVGSTIAMLSYEFYQQIKSGTIGIKLFETIKFNALIWGTVWAIAVVALIIGVMLVATGLVSLFLGVCSWIWSNITRKNTKFTEEYKELKK